MDNPLTPKKIERLITLAEGRHFMGRVMYNTEEDSKMVVNMTAPPKFYHEQRHSTATRESSSGIIDLDRVEGFGESGENISISRTTFNPGELTGRSTGTSDAPPVPSLPPQFSRHSVAIDAIASKMDKQTNEINDIMRHSIASNYSFHSKRDLTADEVSLINREAPLPVMQTTHTYFGDSISTNTSNISVGTYFKNRCVEFGKILGKTDSPDRSMRDRSMMPSITEVSGSVYYEGKETSAHNLADDALDSVPVRQPRNTDSHSAPDQSKNKTTITDLEQSLKAIQAHNTEISKQTAAQEKAKPQKSAQAAMNPPAPMPRHIKTPAKGSSKPTDVLLKNLQASFRVPADDTECSVENSLSISKIADYLGKQSNVSITDMLQLQKKPPAKKHPLMELHLNTHCNNQVTKLIDTKKTDTASSAGTINTANTVINLHQLTLEDKTVPELIVTEANKNEENDGIRSKSPSTKSPSTVTLTTVRDNNFSNRSSGLRSSGSPNCTKEEENRSKVPSPNLAYKELDKSVDWKEVLQQKQNKQRAMAKVSENWVEIVTQPVDGFVGVTTPVTITVTTITDSWLTAKLVFDNLPNDGKDINIELPRLPLLLSPGKSENFTIHITSNVELNTLLPFTLSIKDASIDGDTEQKGELAISFRVPVLQAMSSDGMNKLTYPTILEKTSTSKTFVLISDCPSDLQLKLCIKEEKSPFCIKSVQEVKKSEVNKVLLERQGSDDAGKKGKPSNKMLCRLVKDCAIRVSIAFNAPKFSLDDHTQKMSFKDALLVTLMGSNTLLKRVDLVASWGLPNLVLPNPEQKLQLTRDAIPVLVVNNGTVAGNWSLKCVTAENNYFPFSVKPSRVLVGPGESRNIEMAYTGPSDGFYELPIRFEETSTGNAVDLTIVGGNEKLKSFPLKTNALSLSWVRAGRKEVSFKNITDKKVHLRCQIVGDGFSIDLPGGETRGIFVLTFNANECRPVPIHFTPPSCLPHAATLYVAQEKNLEESKKVRLYGCAAGEPVRWSGFVTFSDSAALVRASVRAPIDLKLHNKAVMPAFVAAKVQFNLQYMQIAQHCRLQGAHKIVHGRSYHTVTLRLDWARVERCARDAGSALATVTVLTGAEATRRRILKILRSEAKDGGTMDLSLLPEHLRVLAGPFEGEDPACDHFFAEFDESKSCLQELIGSLQELTAHIDLPQDFAEETTIIISDDTVAEHHTFCN